jgi:hypothetical protein
MHTCHTKCELGDTAPRSARILGMYISTAAAGISRLLGRNGGPTAYSLGMPFPLGAIPDFSGGKGMGNLV